MTKSMSADYCGRAVCLSGLLFSLASGNARAAVAYGSMETAAGLKLAVLLDDVSQKAYLQASGPSANWFGWGFGQTYMNGYAIILNSGNTTGNYFESVMIAYATPTADSLQETSASYSVVNSTITYSMVRPLTSASSSHYSFTTTPATIPVLWAVGTKPFNMEFSKNVETINTAAISDPAIAHPQASAGMLTLTVTNLIINSTNSLEYKTDLAGTNWLSITNLICGNTNFLSGFNVAVPATNSAAFFRARRVP